MTCRTKILLPLLLAFFASHAFASGGENTRLTYRCKAADGNGLLVFRLQEAVSSEWRGTAIAYENGADLSKTLTSAEDCYESDNIKLEGAAPVGVGGATGSSVIVCGTPRVNADKGRGVTGLAPNAKGYRFVFWQGANGEGATARLEKSEAAAFKTVLGDAACSSSTAG